MASARQPESPCWRAARSRFLPMKTSLLYRLSPLAHAAAGKISNNVCTPCSTLEASETAYRVRQASS